MTREQIFEEAKNNLNSKCLILQLPTGSGKSKTAIDLIKEIVNNDARPVIHVLLVVAKIVHKDTWKKEIEKWTASFFGEKNPFDRVQVSMTCYESLHKYRNDNYEIVILDEAQHLSDNRKDILKTINISNNLIILSATLPREIKEWLEYNYITYNIKSTLQNAIDSDILPQMTIYKIPLEFDDKISETIIKNGNKNLPIKECMYNERWFFINNKKIELHIHCTKREYLRDLEGLLEWYKSMMYNNLNWARVKWLRLCDNRLKWLSNLKNNYILQLLEILKDKRVLTFCSTIEQTEILGCNYIHSKAKVAKKTLEDFNNDKINHITSCQILNEGVNLHNCQIGILANMNASDIIITQRFGRILRHKNPFIIIPYYKGTREEELVNKHLEDFNSKYIKELTIEESFNLFKSLKNE